MEKEEKITQTGLTKSRQKKKYITKVTDRKIVKMKKILCADKHIYIYIYIYIYTHTYIMGLNRQHQPLIKLHEPKHVACFILPFIVCD